MAVTEWVAYVELEEQGDTIGTLLAARTSLGYVPWMSGEVEKRGFTVAWTPLLPYLLARSALDPETIPTDPHAGGGAVVPTEGQLWPRST